VRPFRRLENRARPPETFILPRKVTQSALDRMDLLVIFTA